MKNMRKFASLLLAMVMIFSLSVTAFAEEIPETTPVTFNHTIVGANPGHTYQAYQIFSGDLHADKLSNVKWGSGQTTHTVGDDATEVVETLISESNALALVNSLTLSAEPTKESTYDASTGNYIISDLPAGYYLIRDKEGTLDGENAAYTDYILLVVDNSSSAPKSSVPTIKKKVTDLNDSTQTSTGGDTNQDSADYDIGDTVPFHIHIELNNHIDSYKTYKLIVTDTMSKGLTFNEDSVVVKLNETAVAADYYNIATTTAADGTTTIVITFSDIKPLKPESYADLIIDYTAVLNENAVIGSAGNPNKVYLEYSNNPHWDGDGEEEFGKTPEDKVIVFTYKLDVDKVDAEKKPLNGAEFTLFKYNHDEASKNPDTKGWILVKVITGNESSKFVFEGLDDGIYKLVETKTPSGYNTIDPIEFRITASHDIESDDPKLTEFSGDLLEGNAVFTMDKAAGSVATQVVNKAGATLPETGGMGTTLIYVVGGIMVLAAGVLLVTKKRMSSVE